MSKAETMNELFAAIFSKFTCVAKARVYTIFLWDVYSNHYGN
jgi:hypothetical protein